MIRKVSSFFCNFANVINNVTICQRFAISTESSSQCICLTIIRHISMYVTTSIVLLSIFRQVGDRTDATTGPASCVRMARLTQG